MSVNPKISGVNQRSETVYASGPSKPIPKVNVGSTTSNIVASLAPIANNAISSFMNMKRENEYGEAFVKVEGMLLKNQDKSNIERRRLVHQTIQGLDISDKNKGLLTQQVKAHKYNSTSLVGGGSVQTDSMGQVVSISGASEPEPYTSVSWTMNQQKDNMKYSADNSPSAISSFTSAFAPPKGAKLTDENLTDYSNIAGTFAIGVSDIYKTLDKHSGSVMGNTQLLNIDDVKAYNSKNTNALAGQIEIVSSLLRSPQLTNRIIDDKKALNLLPQIMNALKVDVLRRLNKDPDAVAQLGPEGSAAKVAEMFDNEITSLKTYGEGIIKNSPTGIDNQYAKLESDSLKLQKDIKDSVFLKDLDSSNPELALKLREDRAGVTEYFFKLTKILNSTGLIGEAKAVTMDWLNPAMKRRAENSISMLSNLKSNSMTLGNAALQLGDITTNPAVFRHYDLTQQVVEVMEDLLKKSKGNSGHRELSIKYGKWLKNAKDMFVISDKQGLT